MTDSDRTGWFVKMVRWNCALYFLAAVSGCTSIDVSDLSKQDIPQGGVAQLQDGLAIRVVPLTDEREIRRRFGSNLLKDGTLPVFVELDNRNAADSFLVPPEKCGLNFGGTAVSQSAGDRPRSYDTGNATKIASLAAALPSPVISGGLFVASAVVTTGAMTENHQFSVNQLEPKMLSPGAHQAGYLYFHLPAQARGDCQLIVPVQKPGGAGLTLSVPLNINLN